MNTKSRLHLVLAMVSCTFLVLTHDALGASKLIQAGPMLGHVSDSQASVWLRAKQNAAVTGTVVQEDRKQAHSSLTNLDDGFHLVHFSNLAAATPTQIEITVKRGDGDVARTTLSFRTAPTPAKTGKVRIAFGSCSKLSQYGSGAIYHCIAKEQPDCAIFLGDNAYFIVADGSDRHFGTTGPTGDWNFEESMTARHLITRVHPDLEPMLRTVPSYGIWDDHDYGPNNADREFDLKEEALRAFRQVWANPGWGTEETPGIFSRFRLGPVDVFLMDDRYHKYSPQRHPDVTVETGKIWGDAQLDWLLAGLKDSDAPVKLIANGTQVLSAGLGGEGHYQEARGERQRLLDFVAENQIGGVIFLSGDRHHSEAMQWQQADGTLLVEATSSPLQQGQRVSHFPRAHDSQLWSMLGNNFGLITVDITEPGRGTVRFETRDESNAVPTIYGQPCATRWTLDQLNYPGGEAVPATWTSIFNGRDLDGWVQKNGSAHYRVEGGIIIGRTEEGSPNSFLCTERVYDDFELMFDVLVDNELNSGVQIRSKSLPNFKEGRVHGPQVEIERSPGNAGYVYSEGTGRGWLSPDRSKNAFRNGQWNHFYVRAQGHRIQTWINGVSVADLDGREIPNSGFIGLQVHGVRRGTGPFEVRWRNLFVKE